MKSTTLNLIRKWFNMILSKEKNVEYRNLTYYWANRLFLIPKDQKKDLKQRFQECKNTAAWYCFNTFPRKDFESIVFLNGMESIEHSRRFEIEFTGLTIGEGKQELGAVKNELYFCLHLGEIIHKQNC